VNGEHKITSSHRDRAALVYLRQSSMAQVREHTESTRSQYALADKAAGLGWARSDIEVIDTDLGISGKWGAARAGFTELVTRVCAGGVGAIFGIEIIRLARSNADVARLAEFARITGTLLIDPDGVYDPADVNDRVLLGFKGTMGEMELHVMAQRLHASKRAAAERGELRTPLPVGYVHDDAGDVVTDPDAGSRPRSPTCSPRSPRAARPTGWSPRSPAGSSRCAPTAEPGPGSCAGASSPTPACSGC
jgi:DNA invertase Pin-like site-specific DNA recombinase